MAMDKSAIERFKSITNDSEIIIGFVGAVGVKHDIIQTKLRTQLEKKYHYEVHDIRISKSIILAFLSEEEKNKLRKAKDDNDEYSRYDQLMTYGNNLRQKTNDNSFLALGVTPIINQIRTGYKEKHSSPVCKRHAFLVRSFKRPEEVRLLRAIYPNGFYLFGLYSEEKQRMEHLKRDLNIEESNVSNLIKRDCSEPDNYGQQTSKTYHLSDFFINIDNQDKAEAQVERILSILFGDPAQTPTFDEYAMFMAFVASLQSTDMARQVGAVITKDNEIIGIGANDVPKYGGGHYWIDYDSQRKRYSDKPDGRDHTRGHDSNKKEIRIIFEDIAQIVCEKLGQNFNPSLLENISESKLAEITEFGRSVHAEMAAILACTKNGIKTNGTDLYVTLLPCHNCAKHIISSGIQSVTYIEPYPKSRAEDLHSDALCLYPSVLFTIEKSVFFNYNVVCADK
jgi:deoxycytidylate deaminase